MLDHSSSTPVATEEPASAAAQQPPDPLTEILRGLRLEGIEYGRCELHAPWSVAFPAHAQAHFHFVASGTSWLRTGDAGWLRLARGDAVLLPRGSPHVLASEPDVPPRAIGTLPRVGVDQGVYLVRDPGAQASPSHVMFCGRMRFNLDARHPLLTMMPEVIRAGDLAQRDPTVPALLEAMEREIAQGRVGACGILSRLADVLVATILRAWAECACSNPTGWLAALRSPTLGKVLAAIHADPGRDWDVPTLAKLMGASRSRFAQAFKDQVGESPAKYVARLRMFQAREWIAQEGLRVSVAAERLGYESDASFSRAFKRVVGHPPGASARGVGRDAVAA